MGPNLINPDGGLFGRLPLEPAGGSPNSHPLALSQFHLVPVLTGTPSEVLYDVSFV